jgi:Tol biopolymer transport system component
MQGGKMNTQRFIRLLYRFFSTSLVLLLTLSLWGIALADKPGTHTSSILNESDGALPRIYVQLTDDSIRYEYSTPGGEVTYEIYDSEGGDLLWSDTRIADDNGFTMVSIWDHRVDLNKDMYIVVSDGTSIKELLTKQISLDVFDADANILSGTAGADDIVWVGVDNGTIGCTAGTESNSNGSWSIDFDDYDCADVTEDMRAYAQVFDDDDDTTEATLDFIDGWHDYNEGDVPSYACNVGGWAVDTDNRELDLEIRILADDYFVASGIAGNPREDLLGACGSDGSCGFDFDLWDLITPYEEYQITAQAYDQETQTWYDLYGTPKTLTCRTYDIYAYDPLSGTTKQITNLRDADEYDPTWSQNGILVAHDVVTGDTHTINVTNVKTGVSTVLHGTEDGGNDAAWSPNGKWIAFDRRWFGEPNIYIVPATGGDRLLVRENAVNANWAPNGRRIVFQDNDYGSIRTVPVDGAKGDETLIADSGGLPAWSPDGNWIAYSKDGDIWKVQVNIQGKVLDEPIQLTSGSFNDGKPTWSPDSQTIIYDSGFGDDMDLWSIPAEGGTPTWVTGAPVFGEYGPANARNSSTIAYASFSPEGQAPRNWGAVFTYDNEPWGSGEHSYYFENSYTLPEPGGGVSPIQTFTVSDDAPRYDGTVLLRPRGLLARFGEECGSIDPLLYPDQKTKFQYGWVMDDPVTYPEALAHFNSMIVNAYWDGDMTADFVRHEIIPWGTFNVVQYLCTETAGPPKMDLRVNYGHDWVESFYEDGHQVVITVTDGEGEEKATATVFTESKEFWEGATGFQTTSDGWTPNQPDIQPGDWVYAQVDNGVTARVHIGDISGVIDLMNDSIEGTINAPWFSESLLVECHPWGAPIPEDELGMKYSTAMPDGSDTYLCSWSGEWDIQYYQDVGVGYFGRDGHWVANAFFVRDSRIVASITENWFYLSEFTPGAMLELSIYESQGGSQLWSGERLADINGFAWVNYDEHLQDLEPGNYLVVSDGYTTKDLIIEEFTFDVFDLTQGLLQGTVPGSSEGRLVWVGIGFENDRWSMEVFSDNGGIWVADFDTRVPYEYSWVAVQIFDDDGDASELRPAQIIGPKMIVGNFSVEWSPFNPEEIVDLRWKDSGNLTNSWQHPYCSGDLEFFGNSWVSEKEGTPEFFFASLVGWGTTGSWFQSDMMVNITSISSVCPASANLPIQTTYQFYEDDLRANLIEVQRVFEFGETPFTYDVRPFIPRLYPMEGFSQVLHPDASSSKLVTQTTEDCGYGCLEQNWDGTWFAIHNPVTGLGMIVRHVTSDTAVALWLDDDGGSETNATSVLMFQPEGGFTGPVIETEYLCFYDSTIWTPSLTLPEGCQP